MENTFRTKWLNLCYYEQIVQLYMRYVLLRSFEYTNNKKDAEYIVLYTFVCTLMLLRELEYTGSVGIVIDCMLSSVGHDVRVNGCKVTKNNRLKDFELFFPDKKTRRLVTALNMLEPFSRHVLVLYHIEAMSTKEIGLLYDKSIIDVRLAIIQAEKELVESLAELLPENTVLILEDVCLWLIDLGENLDSKKMGHVTNSVFSFLVECENSTKDEGEWWLPHIFN